MVRTASPLVTISFLLRFSSTCLAGALSLSAQTSVSLTPLDALAFGTFAAPNGGTVTIGANGSRSVEGLIDIGATSSGVATFEIQGPPSTAYVLSLPSSVTLHRSTGTESMIIDEFAADPEGSGLLDGTGRQIVAVGATLHVAEAQRPGDYSGTFDITIDYQ